MPSSNDVPAVLLNQPNSEFTQQDGKAFVSDKRDRAINCVFCRDLHLTLMFSGLLQKDLFKGRRMFGGKSFHTKLLSRLSHKDWRLLSSPVLLRKLTNSPPPP